MNGIFRSLRVFNYRVWASGAIVSNIGAALVGGPGIVPGCNVGRVSPAFLGFDALLTLITIH